jgi:hypothetical protein
VVIALATHVVLIALAVRSVRILGPPPEPRAIDVRLLQLPPPPPLHRELPQSARATPSSAPPPAAPAIPSPIVVAPTSPPAAIPAQASPSDDAAGRVRAMLRGSAGCDSAAFLKLTQAEQEKCARWRSAQADPSLQLPAPIDPVKRSWYDATMQYRKNGRWMPSGPPGLGVMKVPGLPPGHTLVKVGPLNLGLPPGAFNDDEPPPP